MSAFSAAGKMTFCTGKGRPGDSIAHGVDVGKVQGCINAQQQQAIQLLSLWVLLHVPARNLQYFSQQVLLGLQHIHA